MTEETKKEEKTEEVQELKSIGKKKEAPPEQKKPPPPPPPPPPVVKNRTQIGARLTSAVKAKPLVNRSSDLVPLSRDFDILRRRLRTLIAATKKYQQAMSFMDETRSEVVKQIATLSENSPLFCEIGQASNNDSLVSINKMACTQHKRNADKYQKDVIDYATEWDSITTSRIDAGQEETHTLHAKLNHYQDKVGVLRKKVNLLESRDKKVPVKLKAKVERNEGKLNTAWMNYEKLASLLCNLLEEVTKQGWKDLYPMVKNVMEWEAQRAANDYDIIARVPITVDAMQEIVKAVATEQEKDGKAVAQRHHQLSEKVVPPHDEHAAAESDTTGSYYDESELLNNTSSFEEEEFEVPPCNINNAKKSSPKAANLKDASPPPKSPIAVAL